MPNKKKRSPQEKKKLSLQKDRRNDYGENDKSSRKNIPRSKALDKRRLRRVLKMKILDEQHEGEFETKQKLLDLERFKKAPDGSLISKIEKSIKWRKKARVEASAIIDGVKFKLASYETPEEDQT